MKRIEDIERSVRQLESAGEPAIHNRILDSLISEMENWKEEASARGPFWKSVLQTRLIRLGAPAGAIALLIVVAVIGLRPPDAQAVVAQVAAKVETIEAVVYKVHTKTVINDSQTTEAQALVYHSGLHGSRHDVLDSGQVVATSYVLPQKKEIVLVNHSKREYSRMLLSEATAEQLAGFIDVRRWLDTMATEGKKTSGVQTLGKKIINDVEVTGFSLDSQGLFGRSIPSAQGFVRLWVDTGANLPVLMEIQYTQVTVHRNLKQEKRAASVRCDDFEWDVRLGPDTFEPDIPPDYVLTEPGAWKSTGASDLKVEGSDR